MSFAILKTPRFWIAVAVISFIVALRMTALGDILSLDTLGNHRNALHTWVDTNTLLASAAYVSAYVVVVALSVPGAVILTLGGGLLFGTALGTLLSAVGATAGATIVFLLANVLFGTGMVDRLAARHPALIDGIRENSWAYLLVLRFVPLFPFFLVNLAPALVGVRMRTYMFTTFLGILPGTTVYTLFGSGLGHVLAQGKSISLGSIITPTIMLAFIGLAALSIAAIPIRKWLQRINTHKTIVHGS